MKISRIFVWLSLLAAALTAFVSWQGVYSANTYKLETLNWATQAIGQDYINLFVAVPVLLISSYFVSKKSIKALLIWLGTLFYLIYSYILYTFCIHFGSLFLVYILILSASFYSLLGALINLDWTKLSLYFKETKVKVISIFLMLVAVLFYFLWLSDIITALLSNNLPLSLFGTGLITNPVHVLDLAFLLPGVIIISQLLNRRQILGLVLVVPIMSFLAIMGLAIISIMILTTPDFYSALPSEIMMTLIVLLNLFFIFRFKVAKLEKK